MQNKSEIDQLLRQNSDAKEIPGAVAIAATSKETIYQGVFGKRDLSKDDAMTAGKNTASPRTLPNHRMNGRMIAFKY